MVQIMVQSNLLLRPAQTISIRKLEGKHRGTSSNYRESISEKVFTVLPKRSLVYCIYSIQSLKKPFPISVRTFYLPVRPACSKNIGKSFFRSLFQHFKAGRQTKIKPLIYDYELITTRW
jgi:hypothetical protein